MARIKKVTRNKHEGKIVYGDGIVDGIVYLAVAEIPNAELYTLKQHGKNRSKAIEVTFDRPTPLQIDGETILDVLSYKVEL